MHVNQEARHIAQMRITLVDSPRAQFMVPVRPFRPELDVLYIPMQAWRKFSLFRETPQGQAWLSLLQHVAVDFISSTNHAALFTQTQHMPALKTLRFVLATEKGPYDPSSMLIIPNPITRCTLRPFPADRFVETVDCGATKPTLAEYLDKFDKDAVLSAIAALLETGPVSEINVAILGCVNVHRNRLRFEVAPAILTEYHHSQSGSGFVDLGKDNVADLSSMFS
jgi:hypothetical protein